MRLVAAADALQATRALQAEAGVRALRESSSPYCWFIAAVPPRLAAASPTSPARVLHRRRQAVLPVALRTPRGRMRVAGTRWETRVLLGELGERASAARMFSIHWRSAGADAGEPMMRKHSRCLRRSRAWPPDTSSHGCSVPARGRSSLLWPFLPYRRLERSVQRRLEALRRARHHRHRHAMLRGPLQLGPVRTGVAGMPEHEVVAFAA